MKCPYAVHRKRVTKCNIEYDEEVENQQKSWYEVTNDFADFCNCLKEECGAWHNGGCCYNKN